jgi:hypothetical protein
MKAWKDLENDEHISLYWTGDRENPKTLWYLNYGVKIEKNMETGEIEVKNTMTSSDMYEDVNRHQRWIFESRGWEAGCMRVCHDVYKKKDEELRKLMDNALDQNRLEALDRLRVMHEKVINKMESYEQRLKKIS